MPKVYQQFEECCQLLENITAIYMILNLPLKGTLLLQTRSGKEQPEQQLR